MAVVYIGLGSNMDNPKQTIHSALKSLNNMQLTQLVQVSSLYKSKPIGPVDQADYINAVAKLETELAPLTLLNELQIIENKHGRLRKRRWGPRTLDLDILMYGNQIINNEHLTIPHPEMVKRCFVLIPLAEINPDCHVPAAGPIKALIKTVDQDALDIIL